MGRGTGGGKREKKEKKKKKDKRIMWGGIYVIKCSGHILKTDIKCSGHTLKTDRGQWSKYPTPRKH